MVLSALKLKPPEREVSDKQDLPPPLKTVSDLHKYYSTYVKGYL